jgi:hypothetical protein
MKIKEILNNEILNSCIHTHTIELSVRFKGLNKEGNSEYIIYKVFKLEEIEEDKYRATPIETNDKVNLKEFNIQEIELKLQMFGHLYYELGKALLDEFYSKYPATSRRIYRFFDKRVTEILSKSIPEHIHLYVYTFNRFGDKRPSVDIKAGVVFHHFVKPKKFL